MHLAKGELGKHYRLGWEQKEQAGKSLVRPDGKRAFNLPDGVEYDYDNSELKFNDTEKSSDKSTENKALDVLNRGIQEAK
jgi:ferredoxin-type protein NapG